MRIVYLHQYFNTPDMAGGTRSYEMARRLVSAGHEVHMVTAWREPDPRKDWFTTTEAGITVHWLPVEYSNHMAFRRRIMAFCHFALAAIRRAASIRPDLVFASSTPLTIAIPALTVSALRRRPMVFEVRDLWPEVPIALGVLKNPVLVWLAYRLEGLVYRRSAKIIALAPGMKESIVRRGIPESKVEVIPNGCDFEPFEEGNGEDGVAKERSGSQLQITYTGAMGMVNGVDYIPRLAFEIRKRAPDLNFRFLLFGDGSHRRSAEELAKTLGVWDREVRFAGSIPKREAARWLKVSDAAIITYCGPEVVFRDSVSNKFFDAIAAGLPILANYHGFATTTAVDAGAGFILDREPGKAAEEILPLLTNQERLRAAGSRARCLASQHFDRDMLARRLDEALMAVAGKLG